MLKTVQKLRGFFQDSFTTIETESRADINEREPGQLDGQIIGVLIVATVLISLLEYYGSSNHYGNLSWFVGFFVDDPKVWLREQFRAGEYARLLRLSYWVGCTVMAYLVLPALWIKLVMRRNLRDFGLSIKGAFGHWWIYIGLYLIVLPAVYIVSLTESFQRTYPFYEFADRSLFDFMAWQLIYASQFLALEFFYRGFLIHGLKRRFGIYAILISTIPYCMIHFGKPLPETLGAIIAGIALGWLALYTRSIWLGVVIHVSVAVSMDVFSLMAKGKIF